MPSRFLLVFLAILLDATILFAAKYGHSRFAHIAPKVGPSRRVLLTEKQIERKKLRKEERLKTKEEERKKRQEAKKNGSNNNTTATNFNGYLSTNAPSTATSSGLSSSGPTASPTLRLTAQPSSTPSETPTTNTPSSSEIPSAKPSALPSGSPSSSPSARPSSTPSRSPPDPTSSPSKAPSSSPTTSKPSSRPSKQASEVPTSMPSVQTTIACDDQGLVISGLAMAIIRFKYQIEFKPSVNEDDAVDHVDTSVAQVVASAFLPCFQSPDDGNRRLDEKTNDTSQTFELLAVDSLPKDAVSTTETCTAKKGNWNCVIVQGAVTTYSNDLEQYDLDAVLGSIETSSLYGSLNLPSDESVVTYLSPTRTVSEPIQQAPALPSAAAQGQEQSPSSSPRPLNYVYGIAVASAFVGSVAVAFLVFRYRQLLPPNGALQADREGNLQPPDHQDVDISPSPYEYPTRGSGGGGGSGGGDAASYVSEDTFWRSIMGKRTRETSSNYHPKNARFESDASVALSSIGASFKGALGLEDDIDIESCGSSTVDNPSCLAEVAASFDEARGKEDGRGKKWIDRLGIFANPK